MSQVHSSALNSMAAIDQWMKTISGNITGSSVTGFKGTQLEFGEVLEAHSHGGTKATDGYGSVNPIQSTDSGIMVTGSRTDFSQGSVTQTSQATNLALNGTGFFVLSRTPNPTSISDLTFTRSGSFHFEELKGPVAGTGTFRLVNPDGLFVMGYNTPVDNANRPLGTPPEESQGTDLAAFNTVAPNGGGALAVGLSPIQLDLVRNPNGVANASFNQQGQLFLGGNAPNDLANNPANMHVAVANFANDQGLSRKSGGAYFSYDQVAGHIFAGTAGRANTGNVNHVVGSSNVITPGALENANTSINTVIPEITLAQKSFSATAKIISVGNDLIDKSIELIR